MCGKINPDDVAAILTALHDLLGGYRIEDLCEGWRGSANKLAEALERDDPRDWPEL